MQKNAPERLVCSTAFQSSGFMRSARPSRVMPALFTRMSMRPNSFAAFANASLMESCELEVDRDDERLAARRADLAPPPLPVSRSAAPPAPPSRPPAPARARMPGRCRGSRPLPTLCDSSYAWLGTCNHSRSSPHGIRRPARLHPRSRKKQGAEAHPVSKSIRNSKSRSSPTAR